MTGAITLHDLTLGYDRHPAVHHLDGAIPVGTLLALVGPNGAGKSTLLKAIAGMLRPLSGRIDRGGLRPGRDIAYLPQQSAVERGFPVSVLDTVSLGLWNRIGSLFGLSRSGRAQATDALAAVGLSGFENRALDSLSGGQMQRVLFARLLLQDASVILLDEPFNAIDSRTTAELVALVRRWHGEGRTIVAALHDLDLVREQFPQTLLLARRPIAWGPTGEALTAANLLTARRMIESFDAMADVCHEDSRGQAA